MDFLDPFKRRRHRRRLLIGYAVLGIIIAVGTVLLVYAALGYGVNPHTRKIVHNGLIFIDSQPSDAGLKITPGNYDKQTPARLVLPAGSYDLVISSKGYLDWRRQLNLEERSVVRLNYPLLWPRKLKPKVLQSVHSRPLFVSTPLNRNRLLFGRQNGSGIALSIVDLSRTPLSVARLHIPRHLFSSARDSKLTSVEWAADNSHLLLLHRFGGHQEYVLVDTVQPARSINLSRRFGLHQLTVGLRDGRSDQFYVYSHQDESLRLAINTPRTLAKPFLLHVHKFLSIGHGQVLYIQRSSASAPPVARLWDNGSDYQLAKLSRLDTPRLAYGQFGNNRYFVIGRPSSDFINIYRNPLDNLRRSPTARQEVLLSLKQPGVQNLSFSPSRRFLAIQGAGQVAVYDFDDNASYHFKPLHGLSQLRWLDDFRLAGNRGGQLFVCDFDGSNQHLLTGSVMAAGGFISNDEKQLLTVSSSNHSYRLRSFALRIN